jgi:hypothetical protein
MLASLEPVFLPKRPAVSGPLFATEAPAGPPPAGARAVFNPRGESLGYLEKSQLVVSPGYTADLTRPFPAKLVQFAMARIPESNRQDATPVFDVNGGYVGYLAGPAFYAQAVGATPAQVAQADLSQPNNTVLGMEQETFLIGLGALTSGGALVGLCLGEVICGGDGDGGVQSLSTALRPRR